MENASKALIMAAEVLIGVMIISIGVYLFNTFGKYSAETSREIEKTQIDEFNNKFLKYYGSRTVYDESSRKEIIEPIKCTIHDIASLANLAKKNNVEYNLENERGYSYNTRYIQIDIGNKTNIEKYTNEKLTDLIKKNDLMYSKDDVNNVVAEIKYYKCITCEINENTKYVNYMKFVEI